MNPKLFGSVAHGTAHAGSDIDILVDMDDADGEVLMRAFALMGETRGLFDRDGIDVLPTQSLKTAGSVVRRRRCGSAVSRGSKAPIVEGVVL